jgi:hypothetical protein
MKNIPVKYHSAVRKLIKKAREDENKTMREIKFRAWDKKNKKMFHRLHLATHLEEYLDDFDYEVMQFTGLKDKEGKEIYEGDIVRFSEHYCGDSTIEEQVKVIKWDINGYTDDLLVGSYNAPNWCEVIGNIYQNPELLKE